MYDITSYASSGVPCGFSTVGEPSCAGAPDISFQNPDFTISQIEGLQEFIDAEILDRGNRVIQSLIDDTISGYLQLTKDTTINVTFLTEGACFENSLGVISWKTDDFPLPENWTFEDRARVGSQSYSRRVA